MRQGTPEVPSLQRSFRLLTRCHIPNIPRVTISTIPAFQMVEEESVPNELSPNKKKRRGGERATPLKVVES